MTLLHSLLSPVLKLFFSFQSRRRLPQISGELDVYGLHEPVTISRDKWGVPHIQATNLDDLFFTQGYIHAQDRLWQMELNRRTAKGTLSEVFGELTVDTDRLARTLGFTRLGKQDWELQDEGAKKAVTSYIKGVNGYINSLDTPTPYEFSLIGHEPTEWKTEDVMAISRMVIWQLSHAWYGETIRSLMIDAVGEEHAAELEIAYHPDNPIQLPEGIEFNKIVNGKLKEASGPFLNSNMGSNGWVIAADRSATGNPILANDMHLNLTLPSIWYHNHLRTSELNVTGVSIPGMPMILVGHNEDISWGATLSYIDCEDLFVEQFSEEKQYQYKFKDKWKEAEVHAELIKVKDGFTVQEHVVVTDHGPIISEFLDDKQQVALQSKSLQPIRSISGWYKLNFATNWDEFVESIKLIEAPSLNLVYADKINIGYYVTGRVPVRKKGDGRLPVPGWDGKYEWKDEIPFEEMPHILNPEKGYFLTCNNKVISDDYQHYLGENFMNGFRARRLETYFEKEKLGIDDCKQMQLDLTTEAAALFLSHYENIEVTDPNPDVSKAFNIMMDFDGKMTPDSVGASLYALTRHKAIRILLEKHLGEELTSTYLGDGLHPILLPTHEFYAQDIVVLLRILDDEDSWWLEHAGGKKQLLTRAFKRAYEFLMDRLGTDHSKWQWGRIHQLTFDHALSVREPLDRVFSRGPYPVGGDSETPNQMASGAESFSDITWAPSWRQIIDMGDITKSLAMYAPGQSGQLGSEHYDDLIPMWRDGQYFPILWTRGQIENNEKAQLTLNPEVKL